MGVRKGSMASELQRVCQAEVGRQKNQAEDSANTTQSRRSQPPLPLVGLAKHSQTRLSKVRASLTPLPDRGDVNLTLAGATVPGCWGKDGCWHWGRRGTSLPLADKTPRGNEGLAQGLWAGKLMVETAHKLSSWHLILQSLHFIQAEWAPWATAQGPMLRRTHDAL